MNAVKRGIRAEMQGGRVAWEAWAAKLRADFRFGPLNALVLVAVFVAGLVVHLNLHEYSVTAVALALGSALIIALKLWIWPSWGNAIILATGDSLLIYLLLRPMSESLLVAHKAQTGVVSGIFTPNESTTFGMLRAPQDGGFASKVRFVGFDASTKLVEALRNGEIDGLVLQNPMQMGYLGVKTMVAHLKGEKVEKRIDTGVALVTRDNMDQPENAQLLQPDLTKWLK